MKHHILIIYPKYSDKMSLSGSMVPCIFNSYLASSNMSSAENIYICIQLGPRSGRTRCPSSGGKNIYILHLSCRKSDLKFITHPANTCTCPLKTYAIKNIRE